MEQPWYARSPDDGYTMMCNYRFTHRAVRLRPGRSTPRFAPRLSSNMLKDCRPNSYEAAGTPRPGT
ncbi:hypothetical protein BJX62DRAFT_220540 [Aspergillus germanicus]